MAENLFTNSHILSWLQYFAANTEIDLEHVKILDITRSKLQRIKKTFYSNLTIY